MTTSKIPPPRKLTETEDIDSFDDWWYQAQGKLQILLSDRKKIVKYPKITVPLYPVFPSV